MNFSQMKKPEIVWMSRHVCNKHGISYLQHPHCYELEHPETMKIGFIDIETSQLRADWGIVICGSILPLNSNQNWTRTITKEEVFSKDVDKEVVRDIIYEMKRYDKLIGYYASNMRFDIPFLRTRAVHHNLKFPEYGDIIMEDVYPMIKNKFKLSSNRLGNASEALLGKSSKTKWLWKHWLKAIQGDQKSLDYITDHCRKDTEELKKLYKKVEMFSRKCGTSI